MAIERYVRRLSSIEQDTRFAILVNETRLLEKLSVSEGRIVRAFNVDIDRLKFSNRCKAYEIGKMTDTNGEKYVEKYKC